MRKLLIVDDEIAVIETIFQILGSYAYQLVATTDPHRALEMIETDQKIDLLIADLFMPAMDGCKLLELSREIRPGLKIVLTTGAASDQEIRRWRRRGEFVVPKPWREREFLGTIEAALGNA